MAITLNGGHVARALDFYNSSGKYFILGGTTSWSVGTNGTEMPETPVATDFKLKDIIGLKRVDTVKLVVPDDSGPIEYNNKTWREVMPNISTVVGTSGVAKNARVVPVGKLDGILAGVKLRIGNIYEGTVQSVDISGLSVTLDTAAPVNIPAGSVVLGGAVVENARYVYLKSDITSSMFPQVNCRQIGLCTRVTPDSESHDVLLSSTYSNSQSDEYTSLGILEVLENRVPVSLKDLEDYDNNTIVMILEF